MRALKTFSIVIIFAALSLSGSAAWATGANSFFATAELDGLKVVPSILTSLRATLTLPFRISPPTTTGQAIELRRRNPWTVTARQPSNQLNGISNIRLYFGQKFANGQPIATLCDNIPELPELNCVCPRQTNDVGETFITCEPSEKEEFDLRDIRFPKQPPVNFPQLSIPNVGEIGADRRVKNDASGLKVLNRLINRGLIYVVINSAFTAKLCPETDPKCCDAANDLGCDVDPKTDDIMYTPPATDPGSFIIDGELRGTLRLVPPKN